MLKRLRVDQFAIIEHATLSFASGFNVLTGETGAGKSILIDALNAVLGGRASAEWVRQGAEAFRVEAVFAGPFAAAVEAMLQEQGLCPEEEELILVRRYTSAGKSRALINGCQVPLGILRQLGAQLVDMHGQHENQALLTPDFQLALLDAFQAELAPLSLQYGQVYRQWREQDKERQRLQAQEQAREQRLDLLRWQIQEISQASPAPGEDEELRALERRLGNAERLAAALAKTSSLLSGGDEEGNPGALALLHTARQELEQVCRFDPRYDEARAAVTEAIYQLEEAAPALRDGSEEVECSPQRLAEIQERLALLQKLKRKYGPELADVLSFLRRAQEELDELASGETRLEALEKCCANLQEEAWALARRLDTLRRQGAGPLAAALEGHLRELGMTPTVVLAVESQEELHAAGCNRAELLFSANAGEDPKALQKIASGGELSRVALAIKSIGAAVGSAGTMIFDEIDSGLGGRAAQQVAEKVAAIAREKQVLCITHLPQLALVADRHIHLVKEAVGGRTQTRPVRLEADERIAELARMFYGDAVTPELLAGTARLLAQHQQR